jgi:S1-C subfamily serine protease
MVRRKLAWIAVLFLLVRIGSEVNAADPEDSVVRISASIRQPNIARPWAKQVPVEVVGTGTVIDGKRILTNAHVVLYAGEIFVQDRQGGDRFEAKVVAIGPGIDLATLSLSEEDEVFFQKHPPISRATKRPAVNAPVAVLGFPVGGTGLAATKGTISRIDYTQYNDLTEGLRIQLDAAVNPGNSGGPALVEGRMVGLIFGQFTRAENVGYVIPNEEVDAYMEDIKDGRYDGKPRVDGYYQVLENEALRAKLSLTRTDKGIMVRRSTTTDPAHPLLEGDVIVKVGDEAIDNDGNVAFEPGLRLPFTALVPRLAKSGPIPIRLLRNGKPMDSVLPVAREDTRLVKPLNGRYPTYFVHGPLVFSPAMTETAGSYLRANPASIVGSPLLTRDGAQVAFPGEELVVVTSPLLPHRLVRGYSDAFGLVAKDIDGVPVKNLRHLVQLLRDGVGEFLTIRFHGELSETMVFRRKAIEDATPGLMAEHGIPSRGSEELMQVWLEKTKASH